MIDSGADITGVPVKLLNEDILQCLSRTNRNVTGPSGESLNVLGILNATLCGFNKRCQTDIYVIEQLCKPILGRSEIKKLSILQFGDNLDSKLIIFKQIEKNFPNIFQNIETFKTEMNITIKKDVQPYVQSVPRGWLAF
nr:unnamed protein product [Callosobruchus chinensis]